MRFRTQSDQIQRIGITMNHIAAGCFYKSSGTSAYQSMYGRVTDVQMFGRILSDGDMKGLTEEIIKRFLSQVKCHFELHYYPFDSQVCTILLKKPSKVDKFVDLIPNHLNYSGPLDMAEFVIIDYDIFAMANSYDFDIKVQITMKRRISQHLLSTYLPSLCILIIAQVTYLYCKYAFILSLLRYLYILTRSTSKCPSLWPSPPCLSCTL